MEENNEIQKLFLASGCISEEGFRLYLTNQLSSENNDLISAHLAECEFCREALEGFKILAEKKSPEEINTLMTSLKDNIDIRVRQVKVKIPLKYSFDYKSALLAVAASIILLIGTYFIILQFMPEQKQQLAVAGKKHNTVTLEEEKQLKTLSSDQPSSPGKYSYKIPFYAIKSTGEKKIIEGIPDTINKIVEITENSLALVDDIKGGIKDTALAENGKTVTGQVISIENSKVAYELQAIPAQTEKVEEVGIISKKSKKSLARQRTVIKDKEDGAYLSVDEMPTFPGGEDSLRNYIAGNIHYPSKAIKKGIEGTVNVSFTVETDGTIKDISILQGIGGGCNDEAIRVIKSMPKWIPGKQSGNPVKVKINLPVKFSLAK